MSTWSHVYLVVLHYTNSLINEVYVNTERKKLSIWLALAQQVKRKWSWVNINGSNRKGRRPFGSTEMWSTAHAGQTVFIGELWCNLTNIKLDILRNYLYISGIFGRFTILFVFSVIGLSFFDYFFYIEQ